MATFYTVRLDSDLMLASGDPHQPDICGHLLRRVFQKLVCTTKAAAILKNTDATGIEHCGNSQNDETSATTEFPCSLNVVGEPFFDDFGFYARHLVVSERGRQILLDNSLLQLSAIELTTQQTLEAQATPGLLCSICSADLYRDDGFADGSVARGSKYFCVDCR